MRTILAMTIFTLLAGPALAQPATSMDTELTKGRCRFIADDGEVGDYAVKRCPGLAGARVFTEARVSRVSMSFRWGKAKAENVVTGYSLGNKLEWRGIGDRLYFKPYAVIVRVIARDHETEKTYNVLGVIRIEPRNACLMAVVDETENKDALALARKTADAEAPTLLCASNKPKIVGTASRWAQGVTGFEGGPPK